MNIHQYQTMLKEKKLKSGINFYKTLDKSLNSRKHYVRDLNKLKKSVPHKQIPPPQRAAQKLNIDM